MYLCRTKIDFFSLISAALMETSPLVRFTAQAISYLFHPLFIIAYMMLLLNAVNPYLFAGSVKDDFMLLFIRIVQFTIILPLAAIFLMR